MSYYQELYHYMETVVWPATVTERIETISEVSRLYGAGLTPSYPCHVLTVDGLFFSALLAYSTADYCSIWNSDPANAAYGELSPHASGADFEFTISLNPGMGIPVLYGDYLVMNEDNTQPLQDEDGKYFINEKPF